jgi:hypothetical protein
MSNRSNRKLHTVRLRRPRDPQSSLTRRSSTITPTEAPTPFRWDIAGTPGQLGGLLAGEEATVVCEGFIDKILDCAARVVAGAGDADLVFVGRSPESLHDLLSGLLHETSWRNRLTLLQFSVGYTATAVLRRKQPEALAAFRAYLDSLGLSPAKLIVRERPVALVDLVCTGNTMHQLLMLLRDWAVEEKADWPAVQRKVRVVGILRQDDGPPTPRWKRRRDRCSKPWQWREHVDWMDELLKRGALTEVSVPSLLWDYLGNRQYKTTDSYGPERWGTDEAARPCRTDYHLSALRLARRVFESGCSPRRRAQFAALLAHQEVAMREPWFRRLVLEVRQATSGGG